MPAFDVPANHAFDTYSELVAALNDWLDRSDLTGTAQQMIPLAEARMNRELASYLPEASATLSTVSGLAALPADFGILRRVVYRGQTLGSVTAFSDEDGCGVPRGYSLEQSSLRIWPAGDYSVAILYRPKLPQLSETTPSTDLLQQHPDLYFYGSLMFANGYVADDARAGMFKALWDEALESAKQYFLRQKFSGPLMPRLRVP